MVPKNKKDQFKPFGLLLQKIAVVVVVHQAPNITRKDEVRCAWQEFKGYVFLVDLEMKIGQDLKGDRWPEEE
jgi:hypothetical protein